MNFKLLSHIYDCNKSDYNKDDINEYTIKYQVFGMHNTITRFDSRMVFTSTMTEFPAGFSTTLHIVVSLKFLGLWPVF